MSEGAGGSTDSGDSHDFTIDVQSGLAGSDADAARALFAAVRAADGRGPRDSEVPGASATTLLARRGRMLVGLAWYPADLRVADPAELYVLPAERGRGIGRALVEAVFAAGRGIWAHGTVPAAQQVAQALRARSVRTLWQLRRDLAGPFEVELPEGIVIRTLVPGADDAAFLGVNARAFAWHPEQGRLDQAGFDAEKAEPWFDPEGFFLAEQDGRLLGFHWTKVHPEDPTPGAAAVGTAPPIGEVYVLGVDPQSPVRRLGAPLTAAGLAYLAGRGLDTAMLYVESDNDPATRLYRRLGFTHYASDTVFAPPEG